MRVLVTGAGGFIGSHVTRALLERGHEVHAVLRSPAQRLEDVRDDLRVWRADLCDQRAVHGAVQGSRPDMTIHLAWYTEPRSYLSDRRHNLASVAASANLFSELLRVPCRRLVLGGTCLEAVPASVTSPAFYAVAKGAMHDLAFQMCDERLSVVCGHVFSVYGPGEHHSRAVPSVTNSLLRSAPVDVTEGSQMRDYLHVSDVADGLCTVLDSELVGAVDICSGRRSTIREVFEHIEDATAQTGLIRWGERATTGQEAFDVTGDPRLLKALGWKPSYSLSDGIKDTVAWWMTHRAPPVTAKGEQ